MGQELLLSNEEYYNGFSRNGLDFKLQKKGATMEEYKGYALTYGMDGPTGGGYPNPEIIEGIFAILSGGSN